MACKMYEVEEPIDYYFHRPLAAIVTLFVAYMPWIITPNQITIFGLLLGWLAAWFLYETTFPCVLVPTFISSTTAWYLASCFFFFWITSDCSDGQVARVLKRGTRTGRIVDGTVDVMVLVPNCVVFYFIVDRLFGLWWGRFAAIAAMSIGLHAGLYDQIKNTYMDYSLPQTETSGESAASVHKEFLSSKEKKGWSLETALLGWYFIYLTRQELMFGGGNSNQAKPMTNQQKEAYRVKYAWLMRLASLLGISAHITPMYLTWLVAPFFPAVLLGLAFVMAVPMNLLHLYCAVRYKFTSMQQGK